MGHIGDDAGAGGVGNRDEHYRYIALQVDGGLGGRGGDGGDEVYVLIHHFLADGVEVGGIALGIFIVDLAFVFGIPQLFEAGGKAFAHILKCAVVDELHDADGELFARSAVRGRAAAAHKAEHEAEGKGEQGEGFGDFFHVKSSFQLKIFVGSYKAGGQ